MGKLLTVSVAAYNVEKYLRRALESLTLPDIIDKLEVFVIDDGSTDNGRSIALEFAERFPDSIMVVHKQNGGYGSTINWSLAHASGRFFRPLDGDDWFDPRGLRMLLRALETTEADAVYTPNLRVYFHNDVEVSNKRAGEQVTAKRFCDIPDARVLGMHRLTYRTSVLRAAHLVLPLGLYYTDTIYACAPMAVARTLLPLEYPLYCQRLGREGQSTSSEVRAQHIDDAAEVVIMLAEYCGKQLRAKGPNARQMEEFTTYLNQSVLRLLLRAPLDGRYFPRLRRFDTEIRKRCPAIYFDAERRGAFGQLVRLLRLADYRFARALHPALARFMREHP